MKLRGEGDEARPEQAAGEGACFGPGLASEMGKRRLRSSVVAWLVPKKPWQARGRRESSEIDKGSDGSDGRMRDGYH